MFEILRSPFSSCAVHLLVDQQNRRMDSKGVTQSVDEATRALKSSLTEGSSKLFGSVMDAKRGLFGGITSTFDHVVNIVGGPEDGSKAATSGSGSGENLTA